MKDAAKQNSATPARPDWLQVGLRASPEETEAFAEFITGLGGQGVLWRDEDSPRPQAIGYLAGGAQAPELLEQVHAWARSRGLEPQVSRLAHQDWGENWKKHFKPFRAAPGIIIAPPWERPENPAGDKMLIIDPGMAFGTGQHATTRLCLERLAGLAGKGAMPGRVLDVGTGTGVLGLAAVLLGAESALGLENDPEAVESARRNIELNGLGRSFEVRESGLEQLGESFPLILANITRDTLIALAPRIRARLAPGGEICLSGLLGGQVDDTARAYAGQGLEVKQRRDLGEWSLLVLS